MPDEYDKYRRNLTNYEKGLYFELGRAHEMGETPDKGWVRQFEIRTSEGPRVLDSARTDGSGVKAKERKSGRINEIETGKQLDKERAGLDTGQLTSSTWETVAGERIPPVVTDKMDAMSRDFGSKFQHVTLSREDALRAMRLGQSLASKQMELFRPYELLRADRARERLENIRQIVKERQDHQRVRAAEIAAARQAAKEFPAPEQLRRIETPAADRVTRETPQPVVEKTTTRAPQAERAAARAAAQEFPLPERLKRTEPTTERVSARNTPQTAVEKATREAAERVAVEFPVPHQSVEREAIKIAEHGTEGAAVASVERESQKIPDKSTPEREAAEQKLQAELKIQRETREAQLAQLPPHINKLIDLGQAHEPERAVETPRGQASQVQGRSRVDRGIDRGPLRDR